MNQKEDQSNNRSRVSKASRETEEEKNQTNLIMQGLHQQVQMLIAIVVNLCSKTTTE